MILCLDVGSTQIYGGLFDGDKIKLQFRRQSKGASSSDEYGLFLRSVLRENGFDPKVVTDIALCTVVPEILHSLRNGCRKYFEVAPFVLQIGTKTGLKIKYHNPNELGSDRIANAMAAVSKFPKKNLLIADFGTAITLCAVSSDKEFLGGVIMPGHKISMMALQTNTSRLPPVEIKKMQNVLGQTTVENIQSGLFFGTLGAIKEISQRITKDVFKNQKPIMIATGGFSGLYEDTGIFDHMIPELVLMGIHNAYELNKNNKAAKLKEQPSALQEGSLL